MDDDTVLLGPPAQRRARRSVGGDPDDAKMHDADIVEHYLQ